MSFNFINGCSNGASCDKPNCPGAFTNPTNGQLHQCSANNAGVRLGIFFRWRMFLTHLLQRSIFSSAKRSFLASPRSANGKMTPAPNSRLVTTCISLVSLDSLCNIFHMAGIITKIGLPRIHEHNYADRIPECKCPIFQDLNNSASICMANPMFEFASRME